MTEIDINLVQAHIEKLDMIGKMGNGGTSRLSYSKAWRQGQAFVTMLMETCGMTVERDAIGNLIGTYLGTEPNFPYLMVGSHLDTVPEGGSLDGALGVLTAIECIRTWQIAGYRPLRTVKIIATVEEEGTLFGLGCMGTRFIVGEMTMEKFAALHDKQGKTLAEYFADNGMNYEALAYSSIVPDEVFAFLELHIEQGQELDLSGEPCAIVTDIVGIDRHWITIQGHANHAGTTRMDRRRDALVAASMVVQEVYKAACSSQGLYVATVGAFKVTPGATNVIPGKVEFTIETRAAHDETMENVHLEILKLLRQVEEKYNVKAMVNERRFAPAVHFGTTISEELSKAAMDVKQKVKKMPSWAGHDSKIMARITQCGMIFVTSLNGISHSPEEATRWADVEKGLKILNQAMKRIASIPQC
ncbi:allantoate deiminase/N-carbamoyl-L-amino-acid hydrolase [Sporomusaceae bacterium BoRhaA]|uniref:M20 family metallo-hydrolase n=1 Tax=Pelorhabdus rhamnosifermentans TaxID=2772457 RepID=UPI001C061624|nr:M20 family metallo-hydrolase [Pelorhabdus rhamnosifermentans]MBU2700047.1 allantoate deiminase/N-carbamoyl-L-amino-acid hydrolase [Pelorhabdus rhamnosifermentans]